MSKIFGKNIRAVAKNEAGDRKKLKLKLIQAKKKLHDKVVMIVFRDEKGEDMTMDEMGEEGVC